MLLDSLAKKITSLESQLAPFELEILQETQMNALQSELNELNNS